MYINRLNDNGIIEFRNQLQELRLGTRHQLETSFLNDEKFISPFEEEIEIENIEFANKNDISTYLVDKLSLNNNKQLYYDVGLWTYLSVFYFHLLCPSDKSGNINIKADARYILADPKNWTRYYRHLLACPARLLCELGNLSDSFLASPIHIWGDFHEQLTAYQDIATNKPLIETANVLYWDTSALRLKKGAGSKGGGSPRRFSDIVGQFELTYDLNVMKSPDILTLFPSEFNRWTA